MDVKTIIQRATELQLTPEQIAYIIQLDVETIKKIITTNGWCVTHHSNNKQLNHSGLSVGNPNAMPDSYFIHQLRNNRPIKEIADELQCTRMAIYKLLKRRGLSATSHYNK